LSDHTIASPDLTGDTTDAISFACPRCDSDVTERFYGPCGSCREQLRAAQGAEARQVEAAEYEPKMNVTPNAVATKD
jgi:hypothetical protein